MERRRKPARRRTRVPRHSDARAHGQWAPYRYKTTTRYELLTMLAVAMTTAVVVVGLGFVGAYTGASIACEGIASVRWPEALAGMIVCRYCGTTVRKDGLVWLDDSEDTVTCYAGPRDGEEWSPHVPAGNGQPPNGDDRG